MDQTVIMNFKYNFNTKQIIWILVFLIGIVFMVWQSWSTIDTFISFRTTLATSKETTKTLPPPTVVICQEHNWMNGHFEYLSKYDNVVNVSDKDWVLKQFFRLNDKMNLSIIIDYYLYLELTLGDNYFNINDMESKAIVKEVLNPWNGLCYAIIIPQSNATQMDKDYSSFQVSSFICINSSSSFYLTYRIGTS